MPLFDSLQAQSESLSNEAEKTTQASSTKGTAVNDPFNNSNLVSPFSNASFRAPGGEDLWRKSSASGMSGAGDKPRAIDTPGQPAACAHGLLKTGKDREIENAKLAIYASPQPVRGKAETVHPDTLFQDGHFSQHAISMDLVNPQKTKTSAYVSRVLNRKEGGGVLLFTALKANFGEHAPGFSALQLVENYEGKAPDKDSRAVLAYWAPQGGFVDIPAHPNDGAKYVFTPGFSGCSFCVDQLNEDILRVWHVEGGKEDVQYNNVDKKMHGLGMVNAMEYRDYGYHSDTLGNPVENVTGFAYMKVDENGKWRIHYQGQLAAPNIASMQNTFLGGRMVDARVSKDLKVSKTNTNEPIR